MYACDGLSQLYFQYLWQTCCLQVQTIGKALPLKTRLRFWGKRGKLFFPGDVRRERIFHNQSQHSLQRLNTLHRFGNSNTYTGNTEIQRKQTHQLCSCRRNSAPRQPRGQPPQSLRRPGDAAGGGAGASTWGPAPCHDSWALAGASQGSSGLAQGLRRRAPHPSLVNQEAWSPWFNLSYLDWPGGKAVPPDPWLPGKRVTPVLVMWNYEENLTKNWKTATEFFLS